jgi:hypothetical protein
MLRSKKKEKEEELNPCPRVFPGSFWDPPVFLFLAGGLSVFFIYFSQGDGRQK